MESQRSTNKKIANALFSNNASVFIRVLIAFFLSPFLVHSLGDTKYGVWTIIAALSGYMCLLDLGIVSALTKFSSKYYQTNNVQQLNAVVSTCLFIFLATSLIIILASPFIAEGMIRFLDFDPEITGTIYLLIIIVSFDISLFIVSGTFRGVFAGFLRHDIISFTVIFSSIYKAFMFYIFLSNNFELLSMGLISVSANALAIFVYYNILKSQLPFIKFDFKLVNPASIKKIFFFSRFTFYSMVANQVIFYSDSFVIGYFLGAAAVTHYTIPWSLLEYVKSFCLAISGTYIAVFSEHDALGDQVSLYSAYVSATKFMLGFSNLLSIGMLVFGGAFISIWMGPEYAETGTPIIIIFATVQLVMAPQLISHALLQGTSNHRVYSYVSLVVSVANLLLSILLVKQYGIVGVALGAAIPQVAFYLFFVPIYTTNSINKSLWVYFKDTYLKFLIPSLGLYLSLSFFLENAKPNGYVLLFGEASICALFYFVLIYFFSLNEREKIKIKMLVKK